MVPSHDAIASAAYRRWQQRGSGHGWHDHDWVEAEQALLFRLNYHVIRLSSVSVLGSRARLVCLFCEQAAPRTRFDSPAFLLPGVAGLSLEPARRVCSECAEHLSTTADAALARYLERLDQTNGLVPAISATALKGLAKATLCVLPEAWSDACQETVEWVMSESDGAEPDAGRLGRLVLWRWTHNEQRPSFEVATKTDSDFAGPAVLTFLTTRRYTLVAALPHCTMDDDWDGSEALVAPNVPIVDGLDRWPGPVEAHSVPVAHSARPRRLVALV